MSDNDIVKIFKAEVEKASQILTTYKEKSV